MQVMLLFSKKNSSLHVSTNSAVIINLSCLQLKQIDISEAMSMQLEFQIVSSVAMKQKSQREQIYISEAIRILARI